ncbi:MOSC domain-containing protein [Kitasatospora paracochleata]|uniref:MOSC domain-containing protein n=1 Tax=Kitasatospora paracochleata TaxID=58354 RepID=A0ABT1ISH9_9ACTN|nr:MOSC N-terminal beta barrel domain-containing protein [Kitasatospora paracochleata]MCP2308088.1 hypothetical protein [Kitasatospora paracochleata]
MILKSLYRYPVKSLLGEELAESAVTGRGLAGDREFALLDVESGRIASAKYPRTWQRLLTLTGGPGGAVTGPDGGRLDEAALTALLGRTVTVIGSRPDGAELQRAVPEEVLASGPDQEVAATVHAFGSAAPPGTFFDFAPIHLVTTATLERIAELGPRGAAEAERYRPNLVLAGAGEPFEENTWTGRELTVGPEVRLRVLLPTPRCAVPTLAHGGLPRDPDALRTPARHNRVEPLPGLGPLPCVGAYAEVVTGGRIARGDRVVLD